MPQVSRTPAKELALVEPYPVAAAGFGGWGGQWGGHLHGRGGQLLPSSLSFKQVPSP